MRVAAYATAMTAPVRVLLLVALLAALPAVTSASPAPAEAGLNALLGVGILTADTHGNEETDGSEHARVMSCSAPGPACETEPFEIQQYVRVEVLPGFVGTAHADLVRDGHTVKRVSCTSTGLGATTCDATPGAVPPGEYVLRSSADASTVGAWAVMIRYA